MFDTHTHLNFPDAFSDISEVIFTAHSVGVSHMLIPGTDMISSAKAVEIAHLESNIYAAVGIHPSDVMECASDTLKKLDELVLSSEKVVAVGEIGLDYYWIFKTVGGDKAQKPARDEVFSVQKEYFIAQLDLAKKHRKTVVIHCRQAKKPLLEILNEQWDDAFTGRMVFHCCEPDMDLLSFALSHNVSIGFDGDLTYNQEKQAFIQNVPIESIVLETDAPFLTPEPVRQMKKFPNEPAHLLYVADAVAQLKGISREEVTLKTMENSLALFGLK